MSKGGTATPIRLMKAPVMRVPHRKERDVEDPVESLRQPLKCHLRQFLTHKSDARNWDLRNLDTQSNVTNERWRRDPGDHGKLTIHAQPRNSAPAALK